MSKFFKGIGKAILYVFSFPFLMVGLSIACVICLFIFIFQLGKLIFLFFTGRNLFSDLDEDIKAKEILTAQNQPVAPQAQRIDQSLNIYPTDSSYYTSSFMPPVSNDQNQNLDSNEQKQEIMPYGNEENKDA